MKALCKIKKRGDISIKTTFWLMIPKMPVFISFLKYITNYMMSLADLLVLIVGTWIFLNNLLKFYIKDTNGF